ncbi:MAG TPA: hypothetical protein DDY71_13560 [Spirochaetia bacterium]|nr:MAG: hypothetical protein A2Y30_14635 [Spirochaetes bacterium GWE1_32_154]OHD50191.1 MAG: hypothetical protein A2Y29_12680 [Spirochaetes bacterium GWE2_31_10]HBI38664.1 hypothetical protein [Spirochaetia bacterium]
MLLKKLCIILLLYSSTLLFSENIFWDNEKLIINGKIGKIKTIAEGNSIYLFYADMKNYTATNTTFDIQCMISNDGRTFKTTNISIENGYTNTEYGYDFDATIINGKIYIIYRETLKKITLYEIEIARGFKRQLYVFEENENILYLPKIDLDTKGNINILYYSYGLSEELIFKSITLTGSLVNSSKIGKNLQSVLNPEIKFYNDIIYVVYQAREATASGEGRQLYYKIFIDYSNDFGATWTTSPLVKGDEEFRQNQRPHFILDGTKIYIVWEKDDESFLSHIAYKCIDLSTNTELFNSTISSIQSEGYSPRILRSKGVNYIFWYDNKSGSFQNYFLQGVENELTEIQPLKQIKTRTVMLNPVLYKSKPLLIWNNTDAKQNRLFLQKNDEFVESPTLFVKGVGREGITNNTSVVLNWTPVQDISGIKEYRLILTQDANEKMDRTRVGLSSFIDERTFNNLADGKWYAKIASYDNAGNESAIRELSFEIDTVAPYPPLFNDMEKKEDGSLTSNSPVISWRSEEEEYSKYEIVTNYFNGEFNLEAARNNAQKYIAGAGKIKKGTITGDSMSSFNSLDNGVLVVGVAGYDKAGNKSDFTFQSFVLNSYVPVTYIDSAAFVMYGIVDKVLKITGRGFSVDGELERIIIDRDKIEPYDYVLEKRNLRVVSDRVAIQRFPIELNDGRYFIGVEHPQRGLVFSSKFVRYTTEWLFSFESKDYFSFERIKGLGKSINATMLILTAIAGIWFLLFFLLFRGILITANEKRYVNMLLIEFENHKDSLSDKIISAQKEVIMKIKMSLTVKYTLLILSLVILIVTSTSTVVGIFALRSSSINLTEEIKKRFDQTLTNYRGGINDIIFFNKERFEANDLSRSTAALPNIGFIYSVFDKGQAVGFSAGGSDDITYNNFNISDFKTMDSTKRNETIKKYFYNDDLNKVVEMYTKRILPETISNTEFTTILPSKIAAYRLKVDEQIKKSSTRVDSIKFENILKDIDSFSSHIKTLYSYDSKNKKYILSANTEEKTMKSLFDFFVSIEWIHNSVHIVPELNPNDIQDSYLFYMPIFPINIEGGAKQYAGDVLICYSFKDTKKLLDEQRKNLIFIMLVVTLTAIALSAVGSVILASSTIRPIKKMYNHVNVISTTEDYEKLVGTVNETLTINTGDEIAILANSINAMTHKLIEKAKADKQLLLGKEIQKKFIPLEPFQNDEIDIYGFYEGAKGVSGDYFDYKKIDDEHYAFIICDVAGKAVPAALIMVQISTIFHSFTTNFKPGIDKIETTKIVTEINDTVAERGFQGRFAAILVLIMNIKTGKAYISNAGYTQLLVHREATGKCEWVKLDADSGAAGVFPSYMLPHPYRQEIIKINHGDIIFFFSDGIEESRNGETFVNEVGEVQFDEFGLPRIIQTLDAAHEKTAEGVISHLMQTERKYRGNMEQYDDLTILAVRRV